jgi:hypothetical protein
MSVIVEARLGKGSLAAAGKQLLAEQMYVKSKSYFAASALLHEKGGHRYVVLHIFCQGIETFLKGLLLISDYSAHAPRLKLKQKDHRTYGHNLVNLAIAAQIEFKLKPMRAELAGELRKLNNYYSDHLFRYGSLLDIFIDPRTVQIELVHRRVMAGIRLAERELRRAGGLQQGP